ncbi:LOW QUALITY PROTEIN: hypothetical protein U9M48_041069 [Paspalum notatum var. saurae]|uniref:Integrase catalytic domain-containing protein n=1 Tax=Paspalum notatum var. saurae TaxID=547442 RepID=A0AAQ3UPK4_PASNO
MCQVAGIGKKVEAERRYLDTGASNHMTGSRAAFAELDSTVTGTVRFGDNSVVTIAGRGTILFSCRDGSHPALTGVYFIPRLRSSIIGLGRPDNSRMAPSDRDRAAGNGTTLGEQSLRAPAAHHEAGVPSSEAGGGGMEVAREVWPHQLRALERMAKKEMMRGLPMIEHVGELCDSCLAGKQKRQPFPKKAKFRAQDPMELVHGDLCGPIRPATHGGKRYFLLLVDDHSRYMWRRLLMTKDKAAEAIKEIKARAEAETGKKLRLLWTDRGGEFISMEFGQYCAEVGVERHLSAPYSPQQNGVVERKNQTVVGMARCMLKAKGMPVAFLGEAVTTAVYILNRASTKALDGQTPFEAWHGRKLDVSHLRTFGCVGYVKVTKSGLSKLEDRSKPMVLLGYEAGSKAYRMYDPVERRVVISRDDWTESGAREDAQQQQAAVSSTFVIDEEVEELGHGGQGGIGVQGGIDGAPTVDGVGEGDDDASATTSNPRVGAGSNATNAERARHAGRTRQSGCLRAPVWQLTPPPDAAEYLDADYDREPMHYRLVNDVVGPATPPGLAARELDKAEELLFGSAEEPPSYAEAEKDAHWRQAMEEEMNAIMENGTWELVEPPPSCRPISMKWVYKVKREERGEVVRHKARLVARGFVQREGVDFNEVFAPVARMESVRLLLALAATRGWNVHHMDVKSAFLNGDLKEEVYVNQPPGYVVNG